ncbi:sensor histidine kinase [Paenibacillus oralis]|uniref:Circadian input-output histidine kinase CikA n=1 Tax=Paenibacillus oralis TaxID=2490856 RepID=A0A3P3U044_9BACL|nr:ATP-binding protein [Paenibacillus oralis]RRJ63731.1 sensor histidine kinase [Paenibacillus oralis]
MSLGNTLLINLGMLIAVAYVANVMHKYVFRNLSPRVNYMLSVLVMIVAGWICIKFGFSLDERIIFDLRIVPLIIATLVYPHPLTLLAIGLGIGLMRLSFGVSGAAIFGLVNLTVLGAVCAGLRIWFNRAKQGFAFMGIVTILTVNIINCLNIIFFGATPIHTYLFKIMPIMLPLAVLFSFVFTLILRDFQMGHRQNLELKHANELLRKQTDELHKAKIGLEDRAKQLTLASGYKSEFLATMSHELRTPLNSIINLAQIIAESEDAGDELPEYGRIIYKSGHDLLQIINDILDLSKVEAGRLEIMNEEVVLTEVADWMQVHFDHIASQKKLAYEVRVEEGLPATIVSDPHRIAQILRNLLSNAFKFTDKGKVTLNIRRAARGEVPQGEWIVFAVTDTGIGVPKEQQSAVFESFQQADGSISRRYGGTGLGLPISSNLARLLGGFLRMKSAEGEGSVFSFYLPLQPAETERMESRLAQGR